MNIKSNLHTHTNLCDGENSIHEMVNAALEKEFVSLGFSGHAPLPFANDYAMTKYSFTRYVSEIIRLKKELCDRIEILLGIEFDFDSDDRNFGIYDFVIGSVHQIHSGDRIFAVDATKDELLHCVRDVFGGDIYEMISHYYSLVVKCAAIDGVDIVGHFDLVSKFNGGGDMFDESSKKYCDIAEAAVKKILALRPEMIFELNTGAVSRGYRSNPYPAAFILEAIKKYGGRMIISSDAHSAQTLDFGFDRAADILAAAGFESVLRLRKDGFETLRLK